jgi:oxygen-independent coproporphyrinogen-3 oxidase
MESRSRNDGVRGRDFRTLYVGGGTPSLLPATALEGLVGIALERFTFGSNIELTIEANPESVTLDFVSVVRDLPNSRVSLGAQSFDPKVLETLGRIHGPDTAWRAFKALREAGVAGINIDLIYGSPGETLKSWLESLDSALELGADHISAYCLSIDKGTPLARRVADGAVRAADEGLQCDMYMAGRERLESAGFEGYEISNFAKPEARSVHNQIYWSRGEYIGLGPAAHSFIGDQRWCNHRDVGRYCRAVAGGGDPVDWREVVTLEQALEETVMLTLRTSRGLDLELLERNWGRDSLRGILSRAAALEKEGLIAVSEKRLSILPAGYFVSDEIIARLLPGEAGG